MSDWAKALTQLLKKAKPGKAHPELYGAFVLLTAAGERDAAGAVLKRLEAEPPPKRVPSVFYRATVSGKPSAAEVDQVRQRLVTNSFTGAAPTTDSFRKKAEDDPWRRIDQWRWIQGLVVRGETERALTAVDEYLEGLPDGERGAGYGYELILALSLALQSKKTERIPHWLARHGKRLVRDGRLQEALLLPEISAAMKKGLLRETAGLSASDVKAVLAMLPGPAAPASKKVPRVQKRKVSAEYSQVHLEPETRTDEEAEQVVFQKKGDSARGMSLFPTMVGIATPSETAAVEAEVTVAAKPAAAKGAVQEVAFPLEVRGPLVLRSATDADGSADPLTVPAGRYDVLARFFPKKVDKGSGLRTFRLTLEFLPSGSMKAPKTIRLEGV